MVIGWLAECLQGTGHVSTYALFQPGWWMLLAGLLIVFGVQDPAPPRSVLSALAMAGLSLAGTGWWFRNRYRTPAEGQGEPKVSMGRLALPIWIGSVLHLVLSWADTAMLSAWLTEADVAHYRAAFRLAALLTFTQFAVNALGAPTFGALHAAGDEEACAPSTALGGSTRLLPCPACFSSSSSAPGCSRGGGRPSPGRRP